MVIDGVWICPTTARAGFAASAPANGGLQRPFAEPPPAAETLQPVALRRLAQPPVDSAAFRVRGSQRSEALPERLCLFLPSLAAVARNLLACSPAVLSGQSDDGSPLALHHPFDIESKPRSPIFFLPFFPSSAFLHLAFIPFPSPASVHAHTIFY